MLRLTHPMSLDLTVLGYIRTGKIYCAGCVQKNLEEIILARKHKEADPIYGREASHHSCDYCGSLLAQSKLKVVAAL